jgi:hypothetical protein
MGDAAQFKVDLAAISLPVLAEVGEVAWREFEKQRRMYKLRGGKEPIRNLLAPGAVAVAKLYRLRARSSISL